MRAHSSPLVFALVASPLATFGYLCSSTHSLSLTLTHSHSLSLAPSLTHSLTHSLTDSLTHLPLHSLTHSLTYSLTPSLPRWLAHSLHSRSPSLIDSLSHSFTAWEGRCGCGTSQPVAISACLLVFDSFLKATSPEFTCAEISGDEHRPQEFPTNRCDEWSLQIPQGALFQAVGVLKQLRCSDLRRHSACD